MLVRSPVLGACTLAIVPVVGVLNQFYGSWLSKNAIRVQSKLADATSFAHESLACIKTVITLACEDEERDKYRHEVRGRSPAAPLRQALSAGTPSPRALSAALRPAPCVLDR